MKPILERLLDGEILLGDGGLGTLLLNKGLEPGGCPEMLNFSNPSVLEEIARQYKAAGASFLETNTFGASPMKLEEFGLADRCESINERAVALLKKVAAGTHYVSGSCGPSGKLLLPYGDADPVYLAEGFERQLRAQINAGVDTICIETMMDLEEAKIALRAAKKVSNSVPVMVTMTFQETPRGFFTMMGTSVADAVKALQDEGADVIGSNCGNGMEAMIQIAKEFKKVSRLPLLIQANAGLPELGDKNPIYPESPGFFGEKTSGLLRAGVSIIGGCCGTTPEHIRAIKEVVDATY